MIIHETDYFFNTGKHFLDDIYFVLGVINPYKVCSNLLTTADDMVRVAFCNVFSILTCVESANL